MVKRHTYGIGTFTLMAFITSLLVSCSGPLPRSASDQTRRTHVIEKAAFMLGDWKQESEEGTTYESWKRTNDSVFSGISFTIKGNDTLYSEKIRLEEHNNTLQYIPVTNGQADDMAMVFSMVESTKNSLHFENPFHDFPQHITYTRKTPDTIIAEISGNYKGVVRTETFTLVRVK